MFTGIIENLGILREVATHGSNRQFWIESPISEELKIDQSVSHSGVCLTVDQLRPGQHRVTAVHETLQKTNLANWQPGQQINLERCLPAHGRFDGHFVQGHVDTTGICREITAKDGSWEFVFQFPREFAALVIEKGSISVNGTSLTCFDVQTDQFKVAIIPYTFEHTNFNQLEVGSIVNLEFDIIGKYMQRIHSIQQL